VRARLLACLLLLVAAAPSAATDHPLAGDLLQLRDASATRRSVRFRAARDPAIGAAVAGDPRIAGATLTVVGRGAGDGASAAFLPAAGWTGLGDPPGSKGYRFRDAEETAGVRTVLLKPGSAGGKLALGGGGAAWGYALASAQAGPVDVRLTIGTHVYCARFTEFRDNAAGKLGAKDAPAPAACAFCGDGVAEAPEECDDGNALGGDGCAADCRLEDASALCAGVPAGAGTALDKVLVASGLTRPVYVTSPPLDPHRLFIVEKAGTIRVVEHGVLLPTPFLDLSAQVSAGIEQGLLSMAFDPAYETNGFFYVSYTAAPSPFTGVCAVALPGSGDNVVARFHVGADPNSADPTSQTLVVAVDQPDLNHNGGLITFGPSDGFLYFAVGDGANPGDPCEAAQNDLSPLGKLLRLDVHAPLPLDPVAAIWAKGFRNPWRFSLDRASGDLYVGDVGQALWEEVSVAPAAGIAGADFQWDEVEGRHCYEPAVGCDTSGTPPVLEYGHGPGCSVTGGYVYRGCALPDLHGRYFYTDYCDSLIRSFAGVSGGDAQNLLDHPELAPGLDAVISFGEDARGEIYLVDLGDIPGTPGRGEVYRIVPAD
jgi:cysteine-rich repeat protein